MKVSISGSTGLIGSATIKKLERDGHEVIRLVRREAKEREATWDPSREEFDASPLDRTDAAIHLAGENVAAASWSPRVKQRIRASRVDGTRMLCEGLVQLPTPPRTLICASAIGYYGDRGDAWMSEESDSGDGFLCDVSREWEGATEVARDAGMRVVHLRIGVVLSPDGGALAQMLGPFRMGVGGRIGSGRQYVSWISLEDVVGAICHVMMTDAVTGPVNTVAPTPVTNLEFTKTLGRVLRRPTLLPVPAFALRLVLGQMADELLLASTRVEPKKLVASRFEFRHPTLEPALRQLLGR